MDSCLANKTKRMGNIIKLFKDGGKIDLDQHYVWFKNNYPLDGPLCGDFRIGEIETDDTKFACRSITLEKKQYSQSIPRRMISQNHPFKHTQSKPLIDVSMKDKTNVDKLQRVF